jgi:hypothetical protein
MRSGDAGFNARHHGAFGRVLISSELACVEMSHPIAFLSSTEISRFSVFL